MKRKLPILLSLVLLAAALCVPSRVRAQEAPEAPGLAESIFLGETVPLRIESRDGAGIEESLRTGFLQGEAGSMEIWWMSPEGREPLEALAKQRPKTSTTYRLAAVLHGEEQDRWLNVDYHVQVFSGSIRVAVEGPEVSAGASALFQLEGHGITLYSQAFIDPDPMGGKPVLLAEFSGLPYGEYTVSAVSGELSPRTITCWLGACPNNDTVDPDRRSALAQFSLHAAGGEAVGESYRLRDAR